MIKNKYRTTLGCLERKHSEITSFYFNLVLQCSLCPAVPICIFHLSYNGGGSLSNFEVDVQVCTPTEIGGFGSGHAGFTMGVLYVTCKHISGCGEQS